MSVPRLTWHKAGSAPVPVENFAPYLMQVLERHSGDWAPERKTPARAWRSNNERLESSHCPKLLARFIDERFGFHYMGAAEYEFGAIPSAIAHLADHPEPLVRKSLTVPAKDLPTNFCRGNINYDPNAMAIKKEQKERKPGMKARIAALKAAIEAGPQNDLVLHYLGPAVYWPYIAGLVKDMVTGKHRNKNSDSFSQIADPIDESDQRYIGWLALDFPFFLVKDAALLDEVAAAFEVAP